MATSVLNRIGATKIVSVWCRTDIENPFDVTASLCCLLLASQYVCEHIATTDTFLLIIPPNDLPELRKDPIYKFSQVKWIYIYYDDNHPSLEQDRCYFESRYPKIKCRSQSDLIRELGGIIVDNAIHRSVPIDRSALNVFASMITQRVSTKLPVTTDQPTVLEDRLPSTSLRGYDVKNIEQIDSRFICAFCRLVFREPYQLVCGHRMCKPCIHVENDTITCLECATISSCNDIRPDRGFRRDMEKLLISCAVCNWTESFKHYQEHIDRQHVNISEEEQRAQPNIPVLLSPSPALRTTAQSQNASSQIHDRISILFSNINTLNNEQQRMHGELSSSQNVVQLISDQLSSLRLSYEENIQIMNRITLFTNLIHQDIRFLIENARTLSIDGTYIWKITNTDEKMLDARSERRRSIYSPTFYSSPTGYKMCMRLYLNGDNDVRDKFISLFFVIKHNEFDAILPWPFAYKVTFSLIDQSRVENTQYHITKYFWPDPTLPCFHRPILDMNEAYGIKDFCPIDLLKKNSNSYIKDNTMFLKCEVNFTAKRPAYLENVGTGTIPNDEIHVDGIDENIML